jgi:hypothetical protein
LFSLFFAPWKYLKRTVEETSRGENDPRLRATDQYLLARFLTLVRVGFVLLFLVGAAALVVSTIETFLPPVALRHELQAIRKNLDETKKQLAQARVAVEAEDRDWSNRRAALVTEAQNKYKTSVKATSNTLDNDARAIQADTTLAPIFPVIHNALENSYSASAGEEMKSRIDHASSITPQQVALLDKYCDDWDALQSLRQHPPRSEDQIRAEVQPEHEKNASLVQNGENTINELKASVADLEKQVSNGYSPFAALGAFLAGAAILLVYIWCYGIAIELFAMVLYLLADVKRLRENSDISRSNQQLSALPVLPSLAAPPPITNA